MRPLCALCRTSSSFSEDSRAILSFRASTRLRASESSWRSVSRSRSDARRRSWRAVATAASPFRRASASERSRSWRLSLSASCSNSSARSSASARACRAPCVSISARFSCSETAATSFWASTFSWMRSRACCLISASCLATSLSCVRSDSRSWRACFRSLRISWSSCAPSNCCEASRRRASESSESRSAICSVIFDMAWFRLAVSSRRKASA